ncbi:MAG: hypothetical protein AAGK32_21910, partial [Actinomycetota bacterium]
MRDLPVIGRPLHRPEDHDLLRGAARFGADVEVARAPGAAHVAFVRSPFAAAAITEIDVGPARRAPGVLGAFAATDLDIVPPGPFAASVSARWIQPLLARDRTRYVGEPVAVVVAESMAAAVDAAEEVTVEYEPEAPVLDLDAALAGESLVVGPGEGAAVRLPADHVDAEANGNIAVDTGWRGTRDLVDDPLDDHDIVVRGR